MHCGYKSPCQVRAIKNEVCYLTWSTISGSEANDLYDTMHDQWDSGMSFTMRTYFLVTFREHTDRKAPKGFWESYGNTYNNTRL